MRRRIGLAVAAAALVTASFAAMAGGATVTTTVAPGNSATLTCSTHFTGTFSDGQVTAACASAPTTTTKAPATTSTTKAPVTTTTVPPTTTMAPSTTTLPASGRFQVSGSRITRNGATFVPNGANVGTAGGFNLTGDAAGHSASAVNDWKWNTIRLTLYVDSSQATTGAAKVIDEYTAKGVVVIVGDWSCFSKGTPTTPSLCAPELAWFSTLAAKYKTNPYVWINCYNEPHATDAAWVALQNACTDTIRAAGNTAPIIADAQGAGADAAWSGASLRTYSPTMGPTVLAHDPLHNVVFSQHNYAGYCSTASEGGYIDQIHAAGLAMMIGEFGITDNQSNAAGTYAQNVACSAANFATGPAKGVGLIPWHGTMNDHYAFRTSGQPFYGTAPLTAFGQSLWNLTH